MKVECEEGIPGTQLILSSEELLHKALAKGYSGLQTRLTDA